MVLLKKIGIFCIPFLLIFGCRKSTNANWDVDLTIPVVNSLLNIKNFVNDSLFQADNSGLLYVKLNREVAAIKLDSLLSLPNTTLPIQLTNTLFAFPAYIGTPISTFPPSEIEFDISNGVKLKKADLRKGSMQVIIANHLTQPIDLVYRIPSALKNGEALAVIETVLAKDSITLNYDLSGYNINMRGISGLTYNTIVQTYTFGLSTTATSSISLENGDGANVYVTFSDIVPQYVEGYFGQQTIDIEQDTAYLGLADNFRASNFLLSDATMDFSILNELGAEFTGSLPNNKSISTPNNSVIALYNNQLSNININRATKSGTTVYPSVKLISFTSANSNITNFISNLPDKLAYSGTIKVNPLGNISGYNDFAFYNTGIRILANINIPLKFRADYFELQSKTDVDFSNIEQLDNVNYGNFSILAKNGFPFSVRLQAYMLDKQNHVIDSLFVTGSNIIAAGALNFNNEVYAPTEMKVNVPVNSSKIEHLKLCKKIQVVSRFIMPPNPPDIKILESYEMKVNIVANLNYNVGFGG